MGNFCSTCFGGRRSDDYDEEDEAQHLFDENNMHYGSFDQQHMMNQEDPQETEREIAALQGVVERTSNNMVDIYDMVPHDKPMQDAPAPYGFANQRYNALLSKLSTHDDMAAVARVDWGTPEDDSMEMLRKASLPTIPIKAEGGEALVGNFTDAAAAMR
ncbi:hypothetical protein GE21DRAFT_9396 [Neurospora crassa]|uniref:Uncharacterized protein n=1 Tax=Neurospora crassa (strain ATCC 24698 / 74-OR23-1A / CBS 708.71 / DSM 1257 / FGSC 987) TaxID=367110 RepID=Q7S2C8_NEUCR|nr:hypothetical protein NCU05950 [Neurospora crassa OR74A]EAA29558.1 hypothetical protein NCU05950 [Neurospora crassa OR74A]KHE87523.1 hypothetical protein GE21DRAFT_9396 [Neurospora crassa]|eukprot:XP_958794.1 hypothetical protein NCU05950 [Neurospora crassa OR74A]